MCIEEFARDVLGEGLPDLIPSLAPIRGLCSFDGAYYHRLACGLSEKIRKRVCKEMLFYENTCNW